MKKLAYGLRLACLMLISITAANAQSLLSYVPDVSSGFTAAELLRLDSLRNNPVYDTAVVVQVSNLWSIQNNGRIVLNLPGSSVNQVYMQDVQLTNMSNPEEGYVWDGSFWSEAENDQGVMEPAHGGGINLVKKAGRVYGYIRDFEGKKQYDLVCFSTGKHVLLRYSKTYLTAHKTCGTGETLFPTARSTSAGPCAPIDVLVLYTPEATRGINIDDKINQSMQLLDGATYNTMGTANAYVKFNLVAKRMIYANEYAPSTSNIDQAVYDLKTNVTVQYLRDLYKADLVICITGNHYGNTVGKAAAIGMSVMDAYAIVCKDNMTNTYTFIHEIGHLMGGRHQQSSVFSASGYEHDDTPGYAHGYGIAKGLIFRKAYNDIMHVLTDGTREHAFSNPDLKIRKKAFGTVNDNNMAQTLLDNACTASEYRTSNIQFFDALILANRVVSTGNTVSLTGRPISGYPSYSYDWWVSYDGGATYASLPSNINVPLNGWASFVMPGANTAVVCMKARDGVNQNVMKYRTIHNASGTLPGPAIGPATNPFKPTGINTLSQQGGKLFVTPNPASDKVQIVASLPVQPQQYTIRITNILGREIASKTISGDQKIWDVDTRSLSSGTYFVRLQSGSWNITEKLVIAK